MSGDEKIGGLTEQDVRDLLEIRDLYKQTRTVGRFLFKAALVVSSATAAAAAWKAQILTLFGK